MPLIEFVDVNMPYCICYFNMPFLVRENRAWCVVACDVASDKLSVTNTATVCGGQAVHVTIYCHYVTSNPCLSPPPDLLRLFVCVCVCVYVFTAQS